MFWWFERKGDYVRCEILQVAGELYELRLVTAEGDEHVEHFTSSRELTKRQDALLDAMTGAGWNGPHGWVL